MLRPGGRLGFSDLDLHTSPPRTDDHTLRSVLYHRGQELVTDWPALFRRHGFTVIDAQDIIAETMPTWDRTQAIYEQQQRKRPRAADPGNPRPVCDLSRARRPEVIRGGTTGSRP